MLNATAGSAMQQWSQCSGVFRILSVKFLFTLPCDSQYSLYFGNIWEILKNTDAHIQA